MSIPSPVPASPTSLVPDADARPAAPGQIGTLGAPDVGGVPHQTGSPGVPGVGSASPGQPGTAPEVGASPYLELGREQWSALASTTPLPLTQADVEKLRGLGDPIDLAEVDAVYRPLSALLENYISATRERARRTADFLGVSEPATPFVVAVAGSVAVGKSTTARLLAHLLARFPTTPRVDLVTTDGFLLPNAVLERRGLTGRKGFPESYDRRALLEFVAAVKSGAPRVEAPVYSHTTYDVVPGARTVVERPDVLVLEGLNVLQPAPRLRPSGPWGPAPSSLAVSDFIDFSIYVDARSRDIERWYLERFLTLKHTAFTRPDSYFRRFAQIPDDIAVDAARGIWESVNLANLRENIAPTRERATLVLVKDSTHHMSRVLLRKA